MSRFNSPPQLPAMAEAPQRETLSITVVPLVLFILTVVTLNSTQFWWVPRSLGVLLAIAFAIQSIRSRALPIPEMVLYGLWLMWSFTGLFGCKVPEAFWEEWFTLAQVGILLLIVAGFTVSRKTLAVVLLAILVAVLAIGAYAYVTGAYRAAEMVGGRAAIQFTNVNLFGWYMVIGTSIIAYFWMMPSRSRLVKYGLLIAGLALTTMACIASGSRMAIIGLVFFYLAWIVLCYGKVMLQRPSVLMAVVGGGIVGGAAFAWYFAHTGAFERFRGALELLSGSTYGGGAGIRLVLFREGLRLFQESPLIGVGLNNFICNTPTRFVGHSEYIEVLCDTGLVGAVLYFGMFAICARRAWLIAKYSSDAFTANIGRLVVAIILTVLLTDLANYHYGMKVSWLWFAAFMGYTGAVWHDLRIQLAERAAPAAAGDAYGLYPGMGPTAAGRAMSAFPSSGGDRTLHP